MINVLDAWGGQIGGRKVSTPRYASNTLIITAGE